MESENAGQGDTPTSNVESLLAQILDAQKQIEQRLDKIETGRDPMEPGTIERPEGIPAPLPPHYPWEELDDTARQAWIDSHRGGPGARYDDAEWETLDMPGGEGAAFPSAPPEVKAEWNEQAPVLFEHWTINGKKGWLLERDAMIETYGKGGPLWFAAYAHEYLMELPQGMRKVMVEQVNKYAPAAGAELARDILRADTDSANAWAYDDGLKVADQRKEGIVRGRDTGA